MTSVFKTKTALLIGLVVIAVVALAFFALATQRKTYVRIVDATSATDTKDTTPAPGADINAVEIFKSKTQQSVYASAVVSSNLLDGTAGNQNAAKVVTSILGSPQENQEPKYVALGPGGDIIVQLNVALKSGDMLVIHEIGAESGPRAEQYTVSISKNPNGPWSDFDTVAGPHEFIFEGDFPFLR